MVEVISLEEFIDANRDEMYERYADLYPEEITSDTYLEDFNDDQLYELAAIIWMEHIAKQMTDWVPKNFLEIVYPKKEEA